jgi:Secretion system C-terminal sorting domain
LPSIFYQYFLFNLKTNVMKRIFTLVFALFINLYSFSQGTIASWGFEGITANPAASSTLSLSAGTTTADAGVLTAGSAVSAFHATATTVFSTPTGNGSPKSLSSNTWSVGDFYQFKAATTGYKGIKVVWDQTGSNTGPAPFKLQYSTAVGGASGYVDVLSYTIPNRLPSASSAVAWASAAAINPDSTTFRGDLSANTALDNKSEVYFRLVCTATTTVNPTSTFGTGGTGRIDNFTVTFQSALPIELTSFNAKSNNSKTNLYWQTASEKNNSHFAIERSTDGDVFSKIGDVKGNGNSTVIQNYQFTDVTPTKGINYYRLRQVDFDGTESISKTVSVNLDGKNQNKVKVYPTLVKDAVSVELSDESKAEISVRDLTGRVILTQNTEGVANQTLNLGTLSSGLYILSVRSNEALETVKIYKQ